MSTTVTSGYLNIQFNKPTEEQTRSFVLMIMPHPVLEFAFDLSLSNFPLPGKSSESSSRQAVAG